MSGVGYLYHGVTVNRQYVHIVVNHFRKNKHINMNEKIILLKDENRIYIRPIDLPKIKPQLKLANIDVKITEEGKYTGKPRYYLPLDIGFPFLISLLSSDYEITFR